MTHGMTYEQFHVSYISRKKD